MHSNRFLLVLVSALLLGASSVPIPDAAADSEPAVDVAAVALVADPSPVVAVVAPQPAAKDVSGADVVQTSFSPAAPIQADADVVAQAAQLRAALKAHDWGLVVAIAALLLVFILTRVFIPRLHGGPWAKVASAVVAWLCYIGFNVSSGMEVADIVYTVVLGAALAGIAIWSPPEVKECVKAKTAMMTPRHGGPGLGMLAVCVLAGGLAAGVACSAAQIAAWRAFGAETASCLQERCGVAQQVVGAMQSGAWGDLGSKDNLVCALACLGSGVAGAVQVAQTNTTQTATWFGTSNEVRTDVVYRVRVVQDR